MGNLRKVGNRIQHKADRLAIKVSLVPLGVAMAGCQLFAAVPETKNPEQMAKRIRSSMAEMEKRSSQVTVRDIYEIVLDMQKQEN